MNGREAAGALLLGLVAGALIGIAIDEYRQPARGRAQSPDSTPEPVPAFTPVQPVRTAATVVDQDQAVTVPAAPSSTGTYPAVPLATNRCQRRSHDRAIRTGREHVPGWRVKLARRLLDPLSDRAHALAAGGHGVLLVILASLGLWTRQAVIRAELALSIVWTPPVPPSPEVTGMGRGLVASLRAHPVRGPSVLVVPVCRGCLPGNP